MIYTRGRPRRGCRNWLPVGTLAPCTRPTLLTANGCLNERHPSGIAPAIVCRRRYRRLAGLRQHIWPRAWTESTQSSLGRRATIPRPRSLRRLRGWVNRVVLSPTKLRTCGASYPRSRKVNPSAKMSISASNPSERRRRLQGDLGFLDDFTRANFEVSSARPAVEPQ
jgi:hypothetical protein